MTDFYQIFLMSSNIKDEHKTGEKCEMRYKF